MEGCPCYTCTHYTQAYLHHVVHAKELIAATLLTIHNEYFIVNLVAQIRKSILDDTFYDFKSEFLGRYGSGRLAHVKAD